MNLKTWLFPLCVALFAVLAGLALIPKWVLPPILSRDYGPSAGEMVVFKDSRAPIPAAQPEVAPVAPGGPAATAAYRNVTVLTGISKAEFDRTMVAITRWVSPGQGCSFCHAAGQPLSADNPRKQIARQMLAMTRTINANWTNHVGAQGVTCYSCHAGKNVPDNRWHVDAPQVPPEGGLLGKPQAWNTQPKTIRNFFPSGPNRMFLLDGESARGVESRQALATTGPKTSPAHDRTYTEQVYVAMMQMSNGLGVNCTYCHNDRHPGSWAESPPNRLNGYSGIVMTRMMNQNYLNRLAPWTDPDLLGAMGDSAKADCKTCHQGAERPVGGMQHYVYPALIGPATGGGPANILAAVNPTIPQLARRPRVGDPASDTLVQYRGEPQQGVAAAKR